MDKDRIAGSAKDFAGKVEGTVGDMAGDAKTQASGRAREAAGTVQNLYGQAKDAARDIGDAATSYARDAYANSGDNLRDGSQRVRRKGPAQAATDRQLRDQVAAALAAAAHIVGALKEAEPEPPKRHRLRTLTLTVVVAGAAYAGYRQVIAEGSVQQDG